MSYHYLGLVIIDRLFYFRLRIPTRLRSLARCSEIKYSLNTPIYQEAIAKWRVEFTHLQAFLTLFEDIVMKINEENKLILTENDVDKLLLHRLEQIQTFLENNVEEIKSRHKSEADIILYPSGEKEADIRKLMTDAILDYLKSLVDKNEANMTLQGVYRQLKAKEIELGVVDKGAKYDWLKAFSTHVNQLDHYAKKSVKAIRQDKHYSPTTPKVITLLRTYDAMKTDERIHRSMAATSWKKFFKRYSAMKKNMKGTTKARLHMNYLSIKLAFLIIGKEYIEEVTPQDCRKLSMQIHNVSARWNLLLHENGKLQDIMTTSSKKALSKTTIQRYLQVFKEYMRYAVKEELIQNSLNDFVDIPIRSDALTREPFTTEELHKIFNPRFYPDPHDRRNIAKFWIPIIALYHGCRQNEICQLDLDDIVQEKGVPCISINDRGEDKSLKNKGSNRIIPIHPKLIDMGFLLYVQYQRKHNEKKLFSGLNRQKRGLYGRAVQSWFARHLDRFGITSETKVFHSFRHTFETMAVEARIPSEYQNAICGWTDRGVGQRVYAHKKDIKIMLEEISKVGYPINRELNELKKEFMDSYVVRDLN